MYCSISGEPPKHPVFSKTTGHVFEKHLLEAYLAENQTDPVTNESATVEDYVELKVPDIAHPRPANLTSLPSLLQVFQNEWDAIALETFTLRKQLLETRQELSTALYQHDAACRVIVRLQKERDEAREALAKVSINGTSKSGEAMDVDETANGLPAEIVSKVQQFKDEAHGKRKKRKLPADYTTLEALRGMQVLSRGEKISRLFSSCALDPESQYNLALFGPQGGLNSIIYQLSSHEWKGQLSDEQGDILDVDWYNRGPVTAGSNGSISVWSPTGTIKHKFEAHSSPVVGIDVHPAGDLLLSTSRDGEWAVHDLIRETTIATYKDDAVFQCSDLHPDGHVYAIGGADGTIRVYDMITGKLNGTLGPRPGGVKSIHFCSNGYWLAETSDADSVVRVWDLRKAQSVAHELEGSSVAGKVRWDRSGQYLALGGEKGVDVWGYQKRNKAFEKVTNEPLENGGVQCFDWTLDATIACGGLSDGSICLLGVRDA